VVTGTDGAAISFRWTQATGLVSLGRKQILGGGGEPNISADGTRIAFGIGAVDSSYTTWGLWNQGSGWQELMPPTPPGGGTVDGTYGSSYDISGDGTTVVGLYNRPGQGNRAHAAKWTQATGVVDLGGMLSGQAGRANGVNHNGSVIVGWVEAPTGNWRPAAWVNGSMVLLTEFDGTVSIAGAGEARATSSNGDLIVGFSSDPESQQRAVTIWRRTDGVFGPPEILGWVDGSTPEYGLNLPYAVSDNGEIIVGYCSFDGSPFASTGFIWTPNTGVIDVNQWLANNGVLVDPNFTIQTLSAMTPDGTKIFGFGQMLTPPYTRRAFRITNPPPVGVAPATPRTSGPGRRPATRPRRSVRTRRTALRRPCPASPSNRWLTSSASTAS